MGGGRTRLQSNSKTIAYTRSYPSTIVSIEKFAVDPSSACSMVNLRQPAQCPDRLLNVVDQEPSLAILDHFARGHQIHGDYRNTGAIRLDEN